MRRKFFKQNAQVQELPNQEMISFYNLLSEKFNNILNYELFLNEQKVKYRAK